MNPWTAHSVPAYIVAQLIGAATAIATIRTLYPRFIPEQAADVILLQRGPGSTDHTTCEPSQR